MLLDFRLGSKIFIGDKVDGNTLTTESTTTTDTMDIIGDIVKGRQIIVDNKRNLLYIDTTGKNQW